MSFIPVTEAARAYIEAEETRLHQHLRSARVQLTQSKNQVHSLTAFADRLLGDKKLAETVHQQSDDAGTWQKPLARMLLQLRDALNNEHMMATPASDIAMESLNRFNQHPNTSEDWQALWLTADVESVPDGLIWLQQLQAVVYPFPLQAKGCAFSKPVESVLIRIRCLLILQAWDLPLVSRNETKSGASASAGAGAGAGAGASAGASAGVSIKAPRYSLKTETTSTYSNVSQQAYTWRLLNRPEHLTIKVTEQASPQHDTEALREREGGKGSSVVNQAAALRVKPTNSPIRPSVITGPAGRWVLNAQ